MTDNDALLLAHNLSVDILVALDSGRVNRIRELAERIRDATADAMQPLPDMRDHGANLLDSINASGDLT